MQMVDSYCLKVLLPKISNYFKMSNGNSSLTVGDVYKNLCRDYNETIANKALIMYLKDMYLVE